MSTNKIVLIVFPLSSIAYSATDVEEIFTNIYKKNLWNSTESISGIGSNLGETVLMRETLPTLLKKLKISTILDAPCGDFNWMRTIDLAGIAYTGIDIVKELIEENTQRYSTATIKFTHLNVITDFLPRADLIICRDLLVHLSFDQIQRTLKNFSNSGSTYLLVTTFEKLQENMEITTGEWRKINLNKAPFNLPEPIKIIREKSYEIGQEDKILALYLLSGIALAK